MNTLFPANPSHGMLFEQTSGVIYQYDTTVSSWIKLASDTVKTQAATPIRNGVMSAEDFRKLNRLVIPAPISSIRGTDCVAPYNSGTIGLFSSDDYINIDGNVTIQNIDQYGDNISETVPFKIHGNTYGFDFTLNIPKLIEDLEKRNQIRLVGCTGDPGDVGDKGEPGLSGIPSGPPGDRGQSGSAPECDLTTETERIQVQTKHGLKKALVDVRVTPDPINDRNYFLEFDRQVVGNENAAASEFRVKQDSSTWVLAVVTTIGNETNNNALECSVPGERQTSNNLVYYVDIEPILEAIRTKYNEEVTRLKKGYEDVVEHWVQHMSNLFDEQKSALCCAIENCISLTKSNHAREHMETLAALTLGKGKIVLNSRDSSEAVEMSSTRPLVQLGHTDLCESGPPFPSGEAATKSSYFTNIVEIDPLNSTTLTAKKVELAAGSYTATIIEANVNINGRFRSNIRIRSISNGEYKIWEFLNKGSFESLSDSKNAYEGLSLDFHHDGGFIDLFLPSLQPRQYSGSVKIEISAATAATPVTQQSSMSNLYLVDDLSVGNSELVNVSGQTYLLVKDGNIYLAIPTFDNYTSAISGYKKFQHDKDFNDIVNSKIGRVIRVLIPLMD